MTSMIHGWNTSDDSPYGITKGIFSATATVDPLLISDALALPLSRIRWNMDGLLIEPSSGNFIWTGLDNAVYQCNKVGLRVSFPLRELSPKGGGTAWCTVGTPCQSGGTYYFGTITAYVNFAIAVCKRYSGDGNPANALAPDGSKRPLWIDCIEVGNEDFDVHGTGTTVAASPCRTGMRYIQYARSIVAAMRKSVSQGGGGWTRRIGMMGWCWMNKEHITEVLNDLYNPPTDATYNPSGDHTSVVALFDYVNFHNYANPPIGFRTNPYTIDQQLIDMRTIMNANGDSARPIWMTEFGATGPVGNDTELQQSVYYAANTDGTGKGALAAARDNGAQHIDIYTADGTGAYSGTNALYYGDPKNIAANLRAGGHKRFLAFSTIAKFIVANPTFPFGFTGGPPPPPPPPPPAPTHYVSGAVGTSGDGTSWATAWKTFANINWSAVQPGDVIEVDGGSSGRTYPEKLTIGASGTAGSPITIRASRESGHDGVVTSWGGRDAGSPLPYSGQATGAWTETAARGTLLDFGNHSYVTVDGGRWHGWRLWGGSDAGVMMGTSSSHNTMRYLEIFDMGIAIASGGVYHTDLMAIRPLGSYGTVYGCDLHDNGQDCMQCGYEGTALNWHIERTWMHFTREHPVYPGISYNGERPDTGVGTHQDGWQEYAGGCSGLSFTDCLFGPGLKEGTIIHDPASGVSYTQCLFLPCYIGLALFGDISVAHSNWTITNVTSAVTAQQTTLWVEGAGHRITDSIFTHGRVELSQAPASTSGVIQYQNRWGTFNNALTWLDGTTIDPQFTTWVTVTQDAVPFADLLAADLTPTATSAIGKGCTHFTSVSSFLAMVTGTPPPPSPLPPPSPGPYTGTLSGFFTPLAGNTVNLTAEGTGDWAHWGVTGTTFDHKSTGGTQISDLSTLGNGVAVQNPAALNSFTWTGGTPNASETATPTGVKIVPPAIPI